MLHGHNVLQTVYRRLIEIIRFLNRPLKVFITVLHNTKTQQSEQTASLLQIMMQVYSSKWIKNDVRKTYIFLFK